MHPEYCIKELAIATVRLIHPNDVTKTLLQFLLLYIGRRSERAISYLIGHGRLRFPGSVVKEEQLM